MKGEPRTCHVGASCDWGGCTQPEGHREAAQRDARARGVADWVNVSPHDVDPPWHPRVHRRQP